MSSDVIDELERQGLPVRRSIQNNTVQYLHVLDLIRCHRIKGFHHGRMLSGYVGPDEPRDSMLFLLVLGLFQFPQILNREQKEMRNAFRNNEKCRKSAELELISLPAMP